MIDSQKAIYAFIDSQNLNLGVQKDIFDKNGIKIYTGWKLNFKKFYFYLKNKFGVSKAFLFVGKVAGNEPLYNYLANIGYHIEFKPTLQYVNGNKNPQIKGNVDAELVLHAMIEFSNYDKAIIVTGDGDYFCLVKYLEANNKLQRILIPNEYHYSSLLKQYGKYMVFISKLEKSLK